MSGEKRSLLQQPPSAPLPPVQNVPPPAYQYQETPAYPPQAQQPLPTSQTVIVAPTVFDSAPVHLRCLNCQRDVVTSVRYENGMLTWLLVLLLFLLGFCLCSCIPCCMTATKDVVHTCPNCKFVCGVHKRIG